MDYSERGLLRIEYDAKVIDPQTGRVEREEKTHNLVTTLGLNHLLNRWTNSASVNPLSYLAVGTDDTAPAVGDTALVAEVDRAACYWNTASGGVITGSAFFNSSQAVGTLTELALDSESSSTIKTRALFANAVEKPNNKWLQVDVSITVTQAS